MVTHVDERRETTAVGGTRQLTTRVDEEVVIRVTEARDRGQGDIVVELAGDDQGRRTRCRLVTERQVGLGTRDDADQRTLRDLVVDDAITVGVFDVQEVRVAIVHVLTDEIDGDTIDREEADVGTQTRGVAIIEVIAGRNLQGIAIVLDAIS